METWVLGSLILIILSTFSASHAETIQIIYPDDAREAVQEAAQALEAVSSHTICLAPCEAARTYRIEYISLFDINEDVVARTEKGCTVCRMQFRRNGALALVGHDMFVHALIHEMFHALADYNRPGYHNQKNPGSVMRPAGIQYGEHYTLTPADIEALNSH